MNVSQKTARQGLKGVRQVRERSPLSIGGLIQIRKQIRNRRQTRPFKGSGKPGVVGQAINSGGRSLHV